VSGHQALKRMLHWNTSFFVGFFFFLKKKMIYILTYLSIFFNLPKETTQGYFCKKQRLG
jgi:hypothetical protein